MKSYLYIIILILCGIICLSFYGYQKASKYNTNPTNSSSIINIRKGEIFYYNNCRELVTFSANQINIPDNWQMFTAKDNIKGNINIDNNKISFKCKTIEYSNIKKEINAKEDIEINIDKTNSLTTDLCNININKMLIYSGSTINFVSNYGNARARNAFVDLRKKEITLKNTDFIFNLR